MNCVLNQYYNTTKSTEGAVCFSVVYWVLLLFDFSTVNCQLLSSWVNNNTNTVNLCLGNFGMYDDETQGINYKLWTYDIQSIQYSQIIRYSVKCRCCCAVVSSSQRFYEAMLEPGYNSNEIISRDKKCFLISRIQKLQLYQQRCT